MRLRAEDRLSSLEKQVSKLHGLVGRLNSEIKHPRDFKDVARSRKGDRRAVMRILLRVQKEKDQLLDILSADRDRFDWFPIESAPKDGREIMLLSVPTDCLGPAGPMHIDPRVGVGRWHPEGTAWVDENGRFDGPAHDLAKTGVWLSGSGWFQPNEVTHWRPLPEGVRSIEKSFGRDLGTQEGGNES